MEQKWEMRQPLDTLIAESNSCTVSAPVATRGLSVGQNTTFALGGRWGNS